MSGKQSSDGENKKEDHLGVMNVVADVINTAETEKNDRLHVDYSWKRKQYMNATFSKIKLYSFHAK